MNLHLLGAALALVTSSCTKAAAGDRDVAHDSIRVQPASAPAAPSAARAPLTPEERQRNDELARSAWRYFEQHYQPSTGLVNGSPEWANTTAWDMGGQILATVAAKELGLLSPADFQSRIDRALATLQRMELFRGRAFNKVYSTRDGSMGRERLGWSATDLGRLLVALKVLAVQEPEFAARAEAIARRNNFGEIVKDGYLHGQMIGSRGQPWTHQEGRIGYEQYIAGGFAQWGADVRNALDVNRNAVKRSVMGVDILEDRRQQDRLLSEPFVLMGLELGLSGDMRTLAQNVLRAQEARYRQTGQVTIVSEDAVSVAPYYFYYYCVYCNRHAFTIDVSDPGKQLDSPRWVSTKAAYGWDAIMPSDYTKAAVQYVAKARDAKRGWASGVYEKTGGSTNTYDINTAAVLLEVAWFQQRGGRPFIEK